MKIYDSKTRTAEPPPVFAFPKRAVILDKATGFYEALVSGSLFTMDHKHFSALTDVPFVRCWTSTEINVPGAATCWRCLLQVLAANGPLPVGSRGPLSSERKSYTASVWFWTCAIQEPGPRFGIWSAFCGSLAEVRAHVMGLCETMKGSDS